MATRAASSATAFALPSRARSSSSAYAHRRAALRCRAASETETGSVAKVRVFTGARAEIVYGAKDNMLACVEREDDDGVRAAVEELRGLNPTPAPAKSPSLLGTWRLVWSEQSSASNPFQRLFGAIARENFQIVNADDTLENLVRLGPLTVSAIAPIAAVSDVRTEVRVSTIDISLFGAVVKRMEMTPTPGRGAGYVEQIFLDDDMRVSVGNKGSVFVHVKDDAAGGGGGGGGDSASAAGEGAGATNVAIARREDAP